MNSQNFVLLTALQLSGEQQPKQWQLEFGLALLEKHISNRRHLKLSVTDLVNEYHEAKHELENNKLIQCKNLNVTA